MWSRVALTVSLFVVTACTSSGSSTSALEPGAGNDPGTQTGTLIVSGDVIAVPSHPNARMPGEFTSYIRVTSLDRVELVKDATVTVTSATGTFPLFLQEGRPYGTWTGSAPGYDEVYVLDVVASTGRAEGIRVDGPDIHVFTRPVEGATIDPTSPMTFAWDSKDRADTATITVDARVESNMNLGVVLRVVDSGEHSLAPDVFTRANPQALQHRVAVERTNAIALKGEDAAWRVLVANEIHVMTPSR